MPPPKKPKNGPTTLEQFMSKEELQVLGKNKRPIRKDGNGASKDIKDEAESSNVRIHVEFSGREGDQRNLPTTGSVSSYDDECDPGSPRSTSQPSSSDRHENILAVEAESERLVKISHTSSQARDFSGEQMVLACSLAPSIHESEGGLRASFVQTIPGSSEGSLLERMFAVRSTERVLLDSGSGPFTAWPRGLDSSSLGQPQAFSHDQRHSNLGYRLTTSNTLASLMTRPAWIPFEPCRPLGGAPGQRNLQLNLTASSSSIDIQGHRPAASFVSMQQHHQQQHHQQQHQQQQQQNLDGRSILALLSGNQITPGSVDQSPPHTEEVFLLKSSPPSRADSCTKTYLSSLMRQPLTQHMSEACGGASSRVINTTHRTEPTSYLHPAFQLPLSTTSSIRKTSSTSSLSLICSPPLGNSCQSGLPRHSNAKTLQRSSPLKQSQGETQQSYCGSSLTNLSGSTNSSSSSMISISSSEIRDEIRLLDLSLKNRHNDGSTISPRDNNTLTSPLRESILLTSKMEELHRDVDQKPSRYISNAVPTESDDSNSYINVTSPVPTSSLLRAISDSRVPTLTEIGRTQIPVSTKLAGLLTTNSGARSSTPGSVIIKDEDGSTSVPYSYKPCKTEKLRHGFDMEVT